MPIRVILWLVSSVVLIKVFSDDPENVAGELVCRGINVMKGYYKNQEATDAVIDKDGINSSRSKSNMGRLRLFLGFLYRI